MGAASFGDIARLRFADEYEGTPGPGNRRPESGGERPVASSISRRKRAGRAYPTAVLWIGRRRRSRARLRLSLASGKEAKEVLFTGYGEHTAASARWRSATCSPEGRRT